MENLNTPYLKEALSLSKDEILARLLSLSLIRGFHKSYFLPLSVNGVEAKVKVVRWGKVYTIDVVEVLGNVEGGEMISFQFELLDENINIKHREVAPEFRRQGIANLVFSIIEDFAKEKLQLNPRLKAIRLEVHTSQASVIQLAEANGFQGETEEAARIIALIRDNSKQIYVNPETRYVSLRATPENVGQSIALRICLVKDVFS